MTRAVLSPIRIGTRGSALALIQAGLVRDRLIAAHPHLAAAIELVPIKTSGDWQPGQGDRRFAEMGGNKGLFTKEIEDALTGGQIDMAVHSLKDVASVISPRLAIVAVTARRDPRDALIVRDPRASGDPAYGDLTALPRGATIGTSSLRRQAQLLATRPDLKTVPLRGNVDTRLRKLADGQVDAIVLAAAGLERMGHAHDVTALLPPHIMLPAAAQGALGVEFRGEDEALRALLTPLIDPATASCVTAERAVMRAIDGSCHTPAGAYATIGADGFLSIEALVARADGQWLLRLTGQGAVADADHIGQNLGERLRAAAPADLFTA